MGSRGSPVSYIAKYLGGAGSIPLEQTLSRFRAQGQIAAQQPLDPLSEVLERFSLSSDVVLEANGHEDSILLEDNNSKMAFGGSIRSALGAIRLHIVLSPRFGSQYRPEKFSVQRQLHVTVQV